jgi:hypothetical protein
MEQCASCGAAMTPGAEWCGQCYAVRGAAPVAQPAAFSQTVPAGPSQFVAAEAPDAGSIMSPLRAAQRQAPPPPMIKTRWRKTPTTFGPFGRLLCTFLLVAPFPVFLVIGILTGGFEIGGAVIWGGLVMPWGLRDVWKAGALPVT